MRQLTAALLLPVFWFTSSAPTRWKETAGVRITLDAKRDQRFVVNNHGMIVLKSPSTPGAWGFTGTRLYHDTIAAPTSLSLGGVGSVDLEPIDRAAQITTRVEGVMGGHTKATTVTAKRIRIQHPDFTAVYTAAAIGGKP